MGTGVGENLLSLCVVHLLGANHLGDCRGTSLCRLHVSHVHFDARVHPGGAALFSVTNLRVPRVEPTHRRLYKAIVSSPGVRGPHVVEQHKERPIFVETER